MAVAASEIAGAAARKLGSSAATAAATHQVGRATGRVSSSRYKSPSVSGVDVAMLVATAGIGVVVSWVGSGRWQRLKRAYLNVPETRSASVSDAQRPGAGLTNPATQAAIKA